MPASSKRDSTNAVVQLYATGRTKVEADAAAEVLRKKIALLDKRLARLHLANLAYFLDQFKYGVNKKGRQIDPSNEMDWHSLTVGWALALGMTPSLAYSFATFVRYNTDLG